MIRLTTMPMPPKVTARPNVLTKASLAARTMQGAYQRDGRRCRSLVVPPSIADRRAIHGEVPERLNGRDWKSRNGGYLVRGFESPPLRLGLPAVKQLRALRHRRLEHDQRAQRRPAPTEPGVQQQRPVTDRAQA